MGLIRELPKALANQIAAGEVIERPASVVKELLENALDAGADSISIDIAHGGLNQIKISDNGSGIAADDLPLALAPHATSKIRELADLFKIQSMGFRGEALASIASIAKVSILSKTASEKHAHILTAHESELALAPSARSTGTTVDVCDLFYNAPVRKKFLKSAKMEFLAIENVVKRFALSAPLLNLQLKHEGKIMLSLPPADCMEKQKLRLSKIFGQTFIKDAHYLEVEHQGMRLTGWISSAQNQRSQNDRLWIYVNQRMVKDKLLQHAIKSAYEAVLHPGRFPACLLYFTLPPDEVDVNVHPTKHELRFQQPRLIHDFLSTHIAQALHVPTNQFTEYPKMEIQKKEYPSELHESKPVFYNQSQLVILDNQYGLLFKGRIPLLVDIRALSIRVSFDTLKNTEKPWLSRPLLVPLYYAFDPHQQKHAKGILDLVNNLGMECVITESGLVQIRSLPIILPQLDVQKCFDMLFCEEMPDDERLHCILAQSQFMDARQLDNETKNNLAAMLEYMEISEQARFVRELNTERLRGIFV